MEKDRKFRALAIAAICVAVVGVSVAYAALTASLTITGTATVNTDASWNVSAVSSAPACTSAGQATVTDDLTVTGQTASWGATFAAPGDSVTCTFSWQNTGTIDAAVTNLVKAATGDLAQYFTYEATMGSTDITDAVPSMKYLKAKTSKAVTIKVTFDEDGNINAETLKEIDSKTATFTASFEFGQADSSKTYTEL